MAHKFLSRIIANNMLINNNLIIASAESTWMPDQARHDGLLINFCHCGNAKYYLKSSDQIIEIYE